MQGQVMTGWGWRLLLAAAMLLMQQAGLRHDLQHALEKQDSAAHVLCQECLSHHSADQAVAHQVPTLRLTDASYALTTSVLPTQRSVRPALGYLSRAPPALSV